MAKRKQIIFFTVIAVNLRVNFKKSKKFKYKFNFWKCNDAITVKKEEYGLKTLAKIKEKIKVKIKKFI